MQIVRTCLVLTVVFCISMGSSPAQRITTLVGGPGNGRPATSAPVFNPATIAKDAAGNMYFGEGYSHTVRKIDAVTGIVSRFAGNGIMGNSGFGGPAVDAQLNSPIGVATDAQGNVYISDNSANGVFKVDLAGIITRIAGNGSGGFGGDGGPATSAAVSPHDIFITPSGDIYITDQSNKRVRKISGSTGIITTVAGGGAPGGPTENVIATSASLGYLSGVYVDAANNIFVCEYERYRILMVNGTTGMLTVVAGSGASGDSGDGGLATSATFGFPLEVIKDQNGDLLISDNQRIRKVNMTTGFISAFAGSGDQFAQYVEGASPLQAKLGGTQGLLQESNGDLLVCGFNDNRIFRITGTSVTTVAGNGGFSGDGGPANLATTYVPSDIALDSDGNVYFSSQVNRRIRKVDKVTLNISTVIGGGANSTPAAALALQLNDPDALAFDATGNLYFVDWMRILKMDKNTGQVTAVAGNTIGFSGDNGPATNASFDGIRDIAFNSAGDLFIADSYNNRVRKITIATGIITTVAGSGPVGVGAGTFAGDGGLAVDARFSNPGAITFDSHDDLYIADQFNGLVRKVEMSTGIVTTITGAGGNEGDNIPAANAGYAYTSALSFAANGDLYLSQAQKIRKIDAMTGFISTVAGKYWGYYGDNGSALDAGFEAIEDIAIAADGGIYVLDQNHSIRYIAPQVAQTISFGPLGVKTYGDAPFPLTATASSTLPVSFVSSNVNVATISGSTITIVGTGTTTITAHQPGDIDFKAAALVQQTLTVDKAGQTLTFEPLGTKVFGVAPFALTATASSNLPVSLVSSDVSVATINGSTLTIVGIGTTTITSTQAGNQNFLPASSIQHILTVTKGDQTLTFPEVAAKTLGGAAFNPGATTSSSLAITYTTTSDKVTISGSSVTMVKAGRLSLKAAQDGNANYNAATPVERSFCINPAKPTITATEINTANPVLSSSNDNGNQWYLNGTAIANATQKTLSVTGAGSFTVKTVVDDCESQISDATNIIVTGLSDVTTSSIRFYPNPATEVVYLELPGQTDELVSVHLVDQMGRSVRQYDIPANTLTPVSLTDVQPGAYVLRSSSGGRNFAARLMRK